MTEFGLIRRYFDRPVSMWPAGHAQSLLPVHATGQPAGVPALGIGDDCALLNLPAADQQWAISSDMLVEGRHFFAGTDPAAIGHKALAVNLSDLAAMGAWPVGFTLALALPAADQQWLDAFCQGMFALAARAACPLVGGDTTRGPLTISITIFGQLTRGQALRRDGARPFDEIWVSGSLGAAALAVACRQQGREAPDEAARRLDWPEPRLKAGLQLVGLASAAMDLSDGLAGDLGHLLEASSHRCGQPLGAVIQAESLPLDPVLKHVPAAVRPEDGGLRYALYGGDDYELLFTVPPAQHDAVLTCCPEARMIGRIVPDDSTIFLERADGRCTPLLARGYDHFAT